MSGVTLGSSAIAAPAYAGIPVTHRGIAASFAVLTGHEDPSRESDAVNWRALATSVDTLVVLMAVGTFPRIVGALLANGRPAETPVAAGRAIAARLTAVGFTRIRSDTLALTPP